MHKKIIGALFVGMFCLRMYAMDDKHQNRNQCIEEFIKQQSGIVDRFKEEEAVLDLTHCSIMAVVRMKFKVIEEQTVVRKEVEMTSYVMEKEL